MHDQIKSIINKDKERFVQFVSQLIQQATPNPPGDTRNAMDFIKTLLDQEGVPYQIVERDRSMPNLVATTRFGDGHKHLVLNGHIDVFPVGNPDAWSVEPWSGAIQDGRIFGRGSVDMKTGTSSLIFTYLYLRKFAENLDGRLTLTVVSDEETFGPNGANFLFETMGDSVMGTACLSGEPSSKHTIRFGEKGAMWIRFDIKTPGGHGAYSHVSENAVDIAMELIQNMKRFKDTPFTDPDKVRSVLQKNREYFDKANGVGAAGLARNIVVNVGKIVGGDKVNMIANACTLEIDVRLPIGLTRQDVVDFIEAMDIRDKFSYEIFVANEANWTDPDHEIFGIVKRTAHDVTGVEPKEVIGIGCTDMRLWRQAGVPGVVYGPDPGGMGGADESVLVEEALDILTVHTLSGFEYLRHM